MWTVMLVDDDQMVIEDMKYLIPWEDMGFSIVSIQNNGQRALEDVKRLKPDIVFTDVVMPVMHGIDLLRCIKEIAPETVVVLLSSFSEFSYAKEAIKLGVYDYILKDEMNPEFLTSLLEAIVKTISESSMKNTFVAEQKMTELFLQPEHENEERMALDGMYYFVCKLDTPFPYLLVMQEMEKNWVFKQEELKYIKELNNEACKIRYVGKLSDTDIVVGLDTKMAINSKAKMQSVLKEFGYHMQKCYEKKYGRTFSVFSVGGPMTAGKAGEYYRKYSKDIKNKYFLGTSLFIDIDSEELNVCHSYEGVDMEKFHNYIGSLNKPKIDFLMQESFAKIQKSKDYQGVTFFLDTCLYILKVYCQENGLIDVSYNEPIDDCKDLKCIYTWLNKIIDTVFTQMKQKEKYSQEVLEAVEYINNHYSDEKLTIQTIADSVNLSYTHLSFLFKKEMGQTLGDYILYVRIEAAKKMLKTGKYKVYQISKACGFANSQYFSQVFKKMTDMKPKDFKGIDYGD